MFAVRILSGHGDNGHCRDAEANCRHAVRDGRVQVPLPSPGRLSSCLVTRTAFRPVDEPLPHIHIWSRVRGFGFNNQVSILAVAAGLRTSYATTPYHFGSVQEHCAMGCHGRPAQL